MSTEVGVAHVSVIARTTGLGKELAKQFGAADSVASDAGKKMGKSLSGSFKSVLKGAAIGGAIAAAVGAGVGKAAYEIGKTFDTMSDTIRVGTGATGKALEDLNTSAKNVGKNVPATFEDTGAVVADLNTLLGLTGKPLEQMSEQFLNLSRITGTDVKSNMAAVTRAFGDWGVEAEKQPEFMDKLFRASQATGVGVDQLAAQVVQFGAPMRGMGFDIDETAALLGQFEKTGVNTELVMGSMRIALGKFAKEGKDAPTALRELMEQIKDAPDDTAGASMAMEIFGQRAGADMADSIRGGKFEIDALMDSIASGSDTINGAAADTASFAEKWQVFKNRALLAVEPVSSAVFAFAGTLMDKALPALENVGGYVERVGEAFNSWRNGESLTQDLVAALGFNTKDGFGAILTEVVGGISAFTAAWEYNDGQVTSSGFPGMMERLANALRGAQGAFQDVTGWIEKHRKALGPFATGIGVVTGAVVAWKIATGFLTAGLWGQAAALAAAYAPITAVVVGLGLLVGSVIWAYKNVGWFRDAVNGAWSWIKSASQSLAGWFTGVFVPRLVGAWGAIRSAVAAVGAWFNGVLVPWVKNAVTVVGAAFRWLLDSVIKPVWGAIRVAIAVVVGIIITYFQGVKWVLENTLGRAFRWLYDRVVKPVFDAVAAKVGAFASWFSGTAAPRVRSVVQWVADKFTWFRDRVIAPVWTWVTDKINAFARWFADVLWPKISMVLGWIGDGFRYFRDKVVEPVWSWISTKITRVWNWVRDKAIDPMVKAVQDTLPRAFEKAQEAVGKAWAKIKSVVAEPIAFVINDIIRDGLIKNINNILEGSFGMDPINFPGVPKNWGQGFRKGGYTGDGGKDDVAGVVHGQEHVIRAESRRSIENTNPGLLDAMNKYGAEAFNPANMAPGDAVYGSARSFGGGNQQAIARAGRLNVAGHAPGWGLDAAIGMLDRATHIKVARGNGSVMNGITVNVGNYPAPWAGYYQGDDGSIMLNNAGAGVSGLSAIGRRTIAAHELGHALGLPHAHRAHGGNGAWSIMNYDNMLTHNSVTAADVAALSKIYGGGGKPGGGGLLGMIGGTIADIVVAPVTKLIQQLSSKFDGVGKDIAVGTAKYLLNSGKDWITSKADGIWDAPVGTTHRLRPGYSTIYNGTGGDELFQRVSAGGGGPVELSAEDRALLREIAERVDMKVDGRSLVQANRTAEARFARR